MSNNGVRLQNLRDFTVQICHAAKDTTVGTGIVVSADGKIFTCAHVVLAAGVNPRLGRRIPSTWTLVVESILGQKASDPLPPTQKNRRRVAVGTGQCPVPTLWPKNWGTDPSLPARITPSAQGKFPSPPKILYNMALPPHRQLFPPLTRDQGPSLSRTRC
ncbi:MAG: hypothetical protein JXM69_14440 [Anaerolineae bacterium]|nr:hypothetical protein [Anaerolineae bacterium]